MALLEMGMGSLRSSPQRRLFAHYPWTVALVVLAISAFGVWNLASATRTGEHGSSIWVAQLQWVGLGITLAFAVSFVDYRTFMRGAYVFYAVVIVLLLLVLWKGRLVMGARRWLVLGPLTFQPSELAKISVAIALSRFFHTDSDKRKDGYGIVHLIVPLALTALPAALILMQPDLGTAIIVFLVGASTILFARVRWKALAIMVGIGLAASLATWPHLKPYQRRRVETFLNPEGDALGAGYHATQSIIAVGSGQVLGKGWGQGTQTRLSFLPEQHTDFIFSVWAEEHGFLGGMVLFLLYYALVAAGITLMANARDGFGHFLAAGLTAMFFWHAFINIGMVMGILPVVGVTLPFMSYGGSSMLVSFLAVGLLANIGMRRFVN
jgi:rod shape determining protein RodA